MALTASQVKAAAARPGAKPFKLADGAGMFLLINPNGSCYWRLKYRIGGKEKLLAIGVYPEVSLAEAREKAQEARKLIKTGTDPIAMRRAEKKERAEAVEHTFERVAQQWENRWRKDKAEGSIRNTSIRLNSLCKVIGKLAVSDIRPIDVAQAVEHIEERSGSAVARRCLSVARSVFRYAKAKGLIKDNPATDLGDVLSTVQPGHFPAQTTVDGLAEVLKTLENYDSPIVRPYLKLLPLLMCRPGELRAMRWVDVDLNEVAPEWRYTIPKTQTDHVVPLSRQAVEIIESMRSLTGSKEYVFAGRSSGMVCNSTVSYALRNSLGIEGQVAHGFRASARTLLDEVLNFRVDLIEHQLGHMVKDPLGRAYNRTSHLPERRRMMQVWSDFLEDLREGRVTGANNVVELKVNTRG